MGCCIKKWQVCRGRPNAKGIWMTRRHSWFYVLYNLFGGSMASFNGQ